MFRDEYHSTELEWIQMPVTEKITNQTVSNFKKPQMARTNQTRVYEMIKKSDRMQP